jgi:hypothetical protein
MFTVRGGLAHQRSCERAVRAHCFEIVPATPPGKVASAEGTRFELDRRLSIRRRQIVRESEIASAGGVYPPAVAVAKRIVPAAVVQPRELQPRRVAVAMRRALDRHLAASGTDLVRHLRLHQLARDDRHRFPNEIAPCSPARALATTSSSVIRRADARTCRCRSSARRSSGSGSHTGPPGRSRAAGHPC